ncbi:MAG TPA: pantetheine-phosphate adenylyltransferase [Bacteroidales bacterium]|jgi:pantetheine-phosphate adenylyltransferase|nr:pantetheine-phosphate adenylyltransferase [Bacteroidales bacterium]
MKDQRIALFPGSFDPFTVGHESVVRRAMPLFDKIIIAIGYNINKRGYFPLEKRIGWINNVFEGEDKIKVTSYSMLTIDYCKEVGAQFILRGLRTSADFEYERAIGQTNRLLEQGIETVFLLTESHHTFITSTIVRDVIRYGGDASAFLPEKINIDSSEAKHD